MAEAKLLELATELRLALGQPQRPDQATKRREIRRQRRRRNRTLTELKCLLGCRLMECRSDAALLPPLRSTHLR